MPGWAVLWCDRSCIQNPSALWGQESSPFLLLSYVQPLAEWVPSTRQNAEWLNESDHCGETGMELIFMGLRVVYVYELSGCKPFVYHLWGLSSTIWTWLQSVELLLCDIIADPPAEQLYLPVSRGTPTCSWPVKHAVLNIFACFMYPLLLRAETRFYMTPVQSLTEWILCVCWANGQTDTKSFFTDGPKWCLGKEQLTTNVFPEDSECY